MKIDLKNKDNKISIILIMRWFSSITNKIKAIVSNATASVRDAVIQQISDAVTGVARRFTRGAEVHREMRQRRINGARTSGLQTEIEKVRAVLVRAGFNPDRYPYDQST